MSISERQVVLFKYTIRNSDGKVLYVQNPIAYLHGFGNIIPGLESAMEGKQEGQRFSVTLSPEQTYGRRQNAIEKVPLQQLHTAGNWQPGVLATVESVDGTRQMMVVQLAKDAVDGYSNHPLAGEYLNFDIEVVCVREATEEELVIEQEPVCEPA